MDLAQKIETRRFVGREFLLWLWFESEIFEATVETREHGALGLWVEGRMELADGQESTAIKGATPGAHREAKESLRRGKLPVRLGLHIVRGEDESRFALKGETLAVSGLVLPTVLAAEANEGAGAGSADDAVAELAARTKRKKKTGGDDAEAEADEAQTAFFERMHFAQDIEAIVTGLYRDFLALRLGDAWESAVWPALTAWMAGDEPDVDAYRAARRAAVQGKARKARAR